MKVRLENVTKRFGSTVAVSNFSAEFPDGHLICLLGPSGCGKSTLLNMLCGIIDVTEGKIFFDDKDVTNLSADLRGIGMVFQNYALYPHMTVLENICFPLEIQKVPKAERKERALEVAKLVHVDNLLKRFPAELSGGQQQRVAIARALIKQPKLLLMDEPLSNLDARLRLEMREEIRRIQQETGVTTIFVTHDQDEALAISDSILLMKDGYLIQKGLCQDLYTNPNCKFVADFLGNPPINNLESDVCSIKEDSLFINDEVLFKDDRLKALAGKKIVLGVRAESFNVSGKDKTDCIKCDLLRVSQMGKENIAYLKLGNKEVRAIVSGDEELVPGSKVSVSLKNRGVFIFDSENGERLF